MEYNGIKNELIQQEVYDSLPPVLKTITEPFDGRERDIVLLSSLGVLSASLPNIYGFYDGDSVSPNVYALIIAPPASGKGVMNYSRILIEPIHQMILNRSRAEIAAIEAANKNAGKSGNGEVKEVPSLEVKIVPANISTAELYSFLAASQHGIVIIESEADTMSNMLKNDWSNYSDVLRKAFHHEPISLSRKIDRTYIDVREPKLSLVMSGTPDQLKPVVQSKGNGLFSRFLLYTFDEIQEFKNVFASSSRNYKQAFNEASQNILYKYDQLFSLENPIEVVLTTLQQERMLEKFSFIHKDVVENHSASFLPNLNRHGVILFRLCMILTALREQDFSQTSWTCTDEDFDCGLNISLKVLKHALIVHNTIDDGGLSKADDDFLFGLGVQFTRQRAVEYGKQLGIPQRTVDDKLVQWRKKKAVKRIKQGVYKRTVN
ncbi:DUF3987 domain-containing protein [Croceivirga sp. JEA036]|uniref:DUF3987 domain-containing protein n=1 Tax=Croceivirga sp. JEA036 TaxID=2721162 RepID=UPI00143887C6|nr:DUF3987 domain-containing protein [Croceivirga sp. JEA036]NJB35310.1 DUF3987 domain-containing protein [Croceivirga sp. JEA036]